MEGQGESSCKNEGEHDDDDDSDSENCERLDMNAIDICTVIQQ